jgi:alkylation response protein AidB-like acyl-CoA dehydrogenase
VTTFVFTLEQQELRRTVRRFLADKSSPEQVRRLMDTEDGYDPAIWSQLSGQLGLVGLTVPEEHGGSGCGPVEQQLNPPRRCWARPPSTGTSRPATSSTLGSQTAPRPRRLH